MKVENFDYLGLRFVFGENTSRKANINAVLFASVIFIILSGAMFLAIRFGY